MLLQNNKLGIVALLATLLSLAAPALAETPLPVIPKGKGDKCVEPTDVMRKNHMEFILHQRDETMYQGIRTKKHSLAECLNCHVPKAGPGQKQVRVDSKDHFCNSCHTYTAVSVDCFQCHSDVPEEDSASAMSSANGKITSKHVDLVSEALKLANAQGVEK